MTKEQDFLSVIQNETPSNKAWLCDMLEFSKQAHENQFRKSGRPFIVHPIRVAITLHQKFGDATLTAGALLHDSLEDNKESYTSEQFYTWFGDDIGFICEALNKHDNYFCKEPHTCISDKIERILYAGMKDIRVLLIKIGDRDDNLRTIDYLKDERQVRMSFESQAIFQPLKEILGYDEKDITIEKARKNLLHFMSQRSITNEKQLKNSLQNLYFGHLDSKLFDLVYNNSDKTVWKIESFETYKKLLENPVFANSSEIIHIDIKNKHCTSIYFQFHKAWILN